MFNITLVYFRIFIDAATLKEETSSASGYVIKRFPHLYRCGHIEGETWCAVCECGAFNFRIFIDAATLKASYSKSNATWLN